MKTLISLTEQNAAVLAKLQRLPRDPTSWRFFLIQRPTQFSQGDILELTDSLSCNPKLLAHLIEGLRFPTI